MKQYFLPLCLGLAVIFSTSALGQTTPSTPPQNAGSNIEKGELVFRRIASIDIMLKLLPVSYTKDQMNQLLTILEKCRAKEKEIRELDAVELLKVDKKIETALTGAIETTAYPSNEFKDQIYKLTSAIAIRRQIATNEMVDDIYAGMKKFLNAGQIKAISNLIDPKYGNGTENPSKMSEEERIRFYIKGIMLDGTTYELLKKMVKFAK